LYHPGPPILIQDDVDEVQAAVFNLIDNAVKYSRNGVHVLEAEGYAVEVVETDEAALHALLSSPPRFDVPISDVMLPGKDGFGVMSEIRRAGQFIPTLISTAKGHSHDVLRGFEVGADDYLTKPFDLADDSAGQGYWAGESGCRHP
jgi:DNA-binding response OmpR family regulator